MTLTRSLLVTVLLAASAAATRAQVPVPQLVGFRGGVGLSDLRSSEPLSGYSKKAGARASAFAEWPLAGPASLLVEIGYAGLGYEDVEFYPHDNGTAVVRAPARLDMLAVPLMVRVHHWVGSVSPFVVAGPRLDVLLNVKQPVWRFDDGVVRRGRAAHRPLGLGVTLGAGVAGAAFGGRYVSLEVRYYADALDTLYRDPDIEGRSQAYELVVGVGL